MNKAYAVLPCNGLDKCAGCISGEMAIQLSKQSKSEIICPVFYRVAEAKYSSVIEALPLLVIDGCGTRCASKLASEKGLKIAEKMNITEEAKTLGIDIGLSIPINEAGKALAMTLVNRILTADKPSESTLDDFIQMPSLIYQEYKKDKFLFRVPENKGFYFNENDVWVYVVGNKARLGVTDFVQQSLSDIMFFTPPSVGMEIEQFEEAGNIESGKAIFEIVSPVSGTIIKVNERLLDAPELINQNPYEQGWIAEIELSDFEEDQDLLHDFEGYFPVLKRKVDEFHV
ncbi:putative zinc-binding protein [Fusibacter sp. 3D3]|uniref:putative zinc-binding protein n=1 Tax=Fusibacter sp. 3D3 TaxID=1048380 RepID=UPI00085364E2|nr:putative zinc-binding protein [Fusibacter sp. 3D3]GAU75999.1 similar to Glycine cleavage system H protein [Fusibacter sp. 3D3]